MNQPSGMLRFCEKVIILNVVIKSEKRKAGSNQPQTQMTAVLCPRNEKDCVQNVFGKHIFLSSVYITIMIIVFSDL